MLTKSRLARLFASPAPVAFPSPARKAARPPETSDPGAEPLVQMKGVTVSYGAKTVLENIDWTVRGGEHWAVLGPNGAGKTTLLSLIAGDHPQAYANKVFLFGKRRGTGESVWEIKRRISLISSELQLRYQKPVSAIEAVLSGFYDSVGLYRRMSVQERRTAERWLSFVGLAGRAKERFDRLSYGERRRVLLARCLVKTPALLILDEPCQGLDPEMRRRFLALIDQVASLRSPSILYVTHDEDEIPACIDRVLRLFPPPRTRSLQTGGTPARPAAGSCKNR
jgi:molybdate transport system ATP-binding protein